MEAQPPHAVTDSNLNLYLDFPIFLFIFIYLLFHCFYLILIGIQFDFAAFGSITTVLHSPPSRASTIATSFLSSP
jgi:hypothetical protein